MDRIITVMINGNKWHELSSLQSAKPHDRCYALQQNQDDSTTILFGDGVNGARPPSGEINIRATYSTGAGSSGNRIDKKISRKVEEYQILLSAKDTCSSIHLQPGNVVLDADFNVQLPQKRLFFGIYRGSVVSNIDPKGCQRLQVIIPSVLEEGTQIWASPCISKDNTILPDPGDLIWIGFEAGDPDYPIWFGTFPDGI
jgi:hypothetical protein